MLSAQDLSDYVITHYSIKNGLTDNNVLSITKDSRGFMWFGTKEGLSRFDGISFRNLLADGNHNVNNAYHFLEESRQGSLYINSATNSFFLNTSTNTFFQEAGFSENPYPIFSFNKISTNRFLLGVQGACFIVDENFTVLDTLTGPLIKKKTACVGYVLDAKTFLIANEHSYFLYDVPTGVFTKFDLGVSRLSAEREARYFAHYDSVKQWLFFMNYETGIHIYSREGDYVKQLASSAGMFLRPLNNSILVWGTRSGISLVNPDRSKLLPVTVPGFPLFEAHSFFVDNDNSFWLGTDKGVFRFRPPGKTIKSWKGMDSYPLTLIKGSDQHIYLAHFTSGNLYRHNKANETWELVTNKINPGAWCMTRMGEEIITTGGGTTSFTRYNPKSKKLTYESELLKPYFSKSDIVILAFQQSNGDQWYSGNKGGGLVRVSARDGKIHHYSPTGNPAFFWSYFATCAEDSEGNVWFAVNKTGMEICKWSRQSDLFEKIDFQNVPGAMQMPNGGIHQLIWDKKQQSLWLAREGTGITKYTPSTNKAVYYQKSDGLASGHVSSIVLDGKDRLWVGTPKGLSCLLPDENRILTFTKHDGLPVDEFVERCLYYDSADNQIWIGGETAIMRFNPDSLLSQKKQEIKVYVDEWLINGAISSTSPTHMVRLSPSENNLQFRLVGLDLEGGNLQYSYKLVGHDPDWVDNLSSTAASYANLLPGTYTFSARVKRIGDQAWVPIQSPLLIHIGTPWFKTWWFRLTSAAAAFLFMMLLVRSYYARKAEKKTLILEKLQAIEKERTRIATDMHDDFGASLSRIKFISEKIKLKAEDNPNLSQDLTKISDYSDEMAEKMNEIVWALNERYDSLDDLISFSRAYAAEYLSQHEIQLQFEALISANKSLQGEVRRNLFLVIKEALHNIVKHAQASRVEITFVQKEQLRVIVTDNGKGFNAKEVRPFANGISNMKKRIHDIGGEVEVTTANGTSIVMQVTI